ELVDQLVVRYLSQPLRTVGGVLQRVGELSSPDHSRIPDDVKCGEKVRRWPHRSAVDALVGAPRCLHPLDECEPVAAERIDPAPAGECGWSRHDVMTSDEFSGDERRRLVEL